MSTGQSTTGGTKDSESDVMNQQPIQNMLPKNFKDKHVLIRVVDDNKRKSKDYKCNLKLIMKHMKYLESKIDPTTQDSELQLCIQCDLETFEWLMRYIHSDHKVTFNCTEADDDPKKLELNLTNIIKLLIPAEFL